MSRKRRPRGWRLFLVSDASDIVSHVVARMRIRSVARHLNTSDLRREWLHHEDKSTKAGRIPVLVSRCPLTGLPIVWMPTWLYPSAFGHSFGCTGFAPRDARWAINEALWCPERRSRIFSARSSS